MPRKKEESNEIIEEVDKIKSEEIEENEEKTKHTENKVKAKHSENTQKGKAKRMKTKKEQNIEKKENSKKNINRQKKEKKNIDDKKQDKEVNETTKNIEISNKKDETKNDTKETNLIVKNEPLNELQLEKIEQEIKKQTTITEEKKNKINKKIFQNILTAICIILYFIFIISGFYNLETEKFYKDLQVFSIVSVITTIVLIEKAYKKDDNELTLFTIEFLVFSITTLLTIYIKTYYSDKFVYIINSISMLFAIYYVGKSIIIYLKMTRKAKKQASDIHKIVKSRG